MARAQATHGAGVWLLGVLLAVVFLAAGAPKLIGPELLGFAILFVPLDIRFHALVALLQGDPSARSCARSMTPAGLAVCGVVRHRGFAAPFPNQEERP